MGFLEVVVAALAMVLVVSGVLKVRDPDSTTPMLSAVGLPASRAAVYAVAAVEIVTGAATLIIGGTAATIVVGLLYAGFAVIGAVLVRSGSAVSCGCFGQRSAAMTPMHVAVNAAAAVLALVAAALGTTGLYATDGDRSAAVLAVATVAAALLAAAIVALLTVVPERLSPGASVAALALGSDARPDGTDAGGNGAASPGQGSGVGALHPVTGLTPAGDPATFEVAGTGRVVLLAFLTSGCTTCSHFWDVFGRLEPADLPGDDTELVIITRGDDHENPARVRDLAPAGLPVVRSTEAWQEYGVVAGPYFVLVDGRRDVVLGEGAASAWTDVAGLVRQAVGPSRPRGMAE